MKLNLFPVTNYSHPIDRAFKLNRSGKVKFLKKENAKQKYPIFSKIFP